MQLTEYILIMLQQFTNSKAFHLFSFPLFRSIRNLYYTCYTYLEITDSAQQKCRITKNSNCHRKSYTKWKNNDRFKIGDYALKNGNTAPIRKLKQRFPALKYSTIRTFKLKVENELKFVAREKAEVMFYPDWLAFNTW